VLDLNEAEAIESGLVSIGNKAQRIPETEGLLDTDFVFESLQRSGGGSLLGRSEGSGRGKKRGKNGELHCSSQMEDSLNNALRGNERERTLEFAAGRKIRAFYVANEFNLVEVDRPDLLRGLTYDPLAFIGK
jgi:hypothetical protein